MESPQDRAPVRLRAVRKEYRLGERPLEVLAGVDLEVAAGEVVAIMGPSGAGKSTLLSCVAGLEVPTGGALEVLGQPIAGLAEADRTRLRRRIGIVYQFFNLVSNLTAAENVALPFWIEGKEPPPGVVAASLTRVGLADRQDHLPSQLSGGEMQLVSIARAIVRGPELLLADEPTGSVNHAAGRRILALLVEVARERRAALVLVTHNAEDAAVADRVVFLRDGAVAGELRPEASVQSIHRRLEELGI